MVLISGINGSGLYAAYSVSAEKDDAGNVITATYMKDALFDFTDSDEISGYNGSAFATPAELSAGINTKIENNIVDVKNVSCSATGSGNIALGTSSIADGKNSFVYGLGGSGRATNIASGNHCIVMGWHSSAMGNYSTVFGGNYCLASGDFDPNDGKQFWGPFAQGVHTSSIGQYSHAEGGNTLANGTLSHAEGIGTLASGGYSHAEGKATSAIGQTSHAEGGYTLASGTYSHAEGYGTSALLTFSHAEGNCTIASSYAMHAGGMYNKTSADALFVIGNGSAESARSDAFIITSGGLASAVTLATSGISDVETAINEISAGLVDTDDFVKASAINCTIGLENSALSGDTFVQGTHNIAQNTSLAQGTYNTASNYSQAFGEENSATNRSFIAGINNSANSGAFVLGSYNNASGAILLGSYLTGKSFEMEDTSYGESFVIDYDVYPVIVGRSNKTSSDAYFVVGNGDDPDAEIRSDAFIVSSNNIASAADFLAGNGVSLSSLTGINIDSYVKYTDLQYAIGSANTATGSTTARYSVALGNKNSAYNSFVIGNYNKGKESHIFGDSNSGINSYIVGYDCTGTESYLFGRELSGKSWGIELGDFGDTCYPVIVGNKNATNTSAYFVVGCGNTLGNEDAFIVSSNKVASAADFRTGNGVSLSSLTGLSQVQADWDETVTSNPAYIQNKPDVLIPVDSPAALGGISKPTNIMVVSALPASPDSATIYLVQGTMIGN